jgi:hypothetical protein
VRRVPSVLLAALAVIPLAAPAWSQDAPPRWKALADEIDRQYQSKAAARANLGQLAACEKSADEPICLLKLAARSDIHRPYAWNVNLAYAPDVLAAVAEADVAPSGAMDLFAGGEREAVKVLLADHAGKPPVEALAPVRAITPASVSGKRPPSDTQAQQDYDDAGVKLGRLHRLQAYRSLWAAHHGAFAIPGAHRPSRGLIKAVLDAWEADAPGDDDAAEELVAARLAFGDRAGAERAARILASKSSDPVPVLLAGQLVAEAADIALRPPAPVLSDPQLAMIRYDAGRRDVIHAALRLNRKDIALRVARRVLDDVQADRTAAGRNGLALGAAAEAITAEADRSDVRRRLTWLDKSGRKDRTSAAASLAAAAARGWLRLDETSRWEAIVADWRDAGQKSSVGCTRTMACMLHNPAAVFEGALMASGHSEEPIPGPLLEALRDDGVVTVDIQSGRTDRIERDLARLENPQRRARLLGQCVEQAATDYRVMLARLCGARLSAGGGNGVDSLIYAANAAAENGDIELIRDLMGFAYRAAAASPGAPLPRMALLPDIAIAELRAELRL